jgi:hypothetical protein
MDYEAMYYTILEYDEKSFIIGGLDGKIRVIDLDRMNRKG